MREHKEINNIIILLCVKFKGLLSVFVAEREIDFESCLKDELNSAFEE
jgi:hypothetical protein